MDVLLFGPPLCPQLNSSTQSSRFSGGMSRAIIHNSDYTSLDAAKDAIDLYFRERSRAQDLGQGASSKQIAGGPELQRSRMSVVDFVADGTIKSRHPFVGYCRLCGSNVRPRLLCSSFRKPLGARPGCRGLCVRCHRVHRYGFS
jgi:hypothetical protein